MLKEQFIKDYFRRDGTVFNWWNPERGDMAHIYARETQVVLEWLKGENIRDILDVSCGRGRILQRLAPSYHVTGLDISSEMLRFVKSLNITNVNLVEGDAENLPFSPDSFDCVICLKSLVHYPNPERALQEFSRVLKTEGILITDVDNARSLKRLIKMAAHSINRFVDREFHPVSEGIFCPFTEKQFRGDLISSGFRIEQVFYQGVIVPIALPLPRGKRVSLINQEVSQQLASLDQRLEQTPGFQKLATYILAKCRKT